jgi:hypothetical protein
MRKRSGTRSRSKVQDRIEECHRALNRSRGHGLALGGGELVTQLGHAILKLVGTRFDLSQAVPAPSRARERTRHGAAAGFRTRASLG